MHRIQRILERKFLFCVTAVCSNMAVVVDTAQQTVDSCSGLHYLTYGVSFGLDGQPAQLVSWEYHIIFKNGGETGSLRSLQR